MQNYEVKTPVRGLPRADGLREPVPAGEIVALPEGVALDLLDTAAIGAIDASVTFELDWPPDVSVTGSVFHWPTAVVAVTDRPALIDAITDLGGLVFFVGEGLPDDAEDVLADFANAALLDELSARIGEGRLAPALMEAVAKMLALGGATDHADDRGEEATVADTSSANEAPPTLPEVSIKGNAFPDADEAKPARKPKAAAK